MDLLVTPEWLALHGGGVTLLDATYHALEPERDARAEFEAGHIPGALYLDLKALADQASPLPSMAPPPAQFAARLAALGVREGAPVVLYDQAPHLTAARAWWLFRLFGIDNVALLDGGMAAWRRAGRPVETGPVPEPGGGDAAVRLRPELVRDLAAMRATDEQVVDARGAARFSGAEADPRAGVAAGHIPGSANIPYGRLIAPDGTWKSPEEIAAAFAAAGVDLDRPIVTSCGSGITASVLLFGLALAGQRHAALYDGSWSEWGALADTPKETGA